MKPIKFEKEVYAYLGKSKKAKKLTQRDIIKLIAETGSLVDVAKRSGDFEDFADVQGNLQKLEGAVRDLKVEE